MEEVGESSGSNGDEVTEKDIKFHLPGTIHNTEI